MGMEIATAIILAITGSIAYALRLAINRVLQIHQLMKDGIDTNSRGIHQYKRMLKGPLSSGHYLHYPYIDRTGIGHEYKSAINFEFWKAHPDGSPIAITYSKSKPEISVPRVQMEQAQAAVANRKG